MIISRRSFVLNGLYIATASSFQVAPTTSAVRSQPVSGCLIARDKLDRIRSSTLFNSTSDLFSRDKHIRTTGDPALDRALDAAITHVSDLFGQRPAFGFYREDDHPNISAMNAFATAEDTDIPGTWGTVGFGDTLFETEMSNHDRAGSTIIAIIAHEFGHIWALHRGVMDQFNAGQRNVRRSELHADYLAGYFIGTRKRASPQLTLAAVRKLFERIGDFNFSSRGHHGTPQERVAAAEEGFRTSYLKNRNADYAFAAASEYVSQI